MDQASPFANHFEHAGVNSPAAKSPYESPYAGSGLDPHTTPRPVHTTARPPVTKENRDPPVAIVTPASVVTLDNLNKGAGDALQNEVESPTNPRLPRDYATKQVYDSKDAISIHTATATAHPSKYGGGATSFQSVTITHQKRPGIRFIQMKHIFSPPPHYFLVSFPLFRPRSGTLQPKPKEGIPSSKPSTPPTSPGSSSTSSRGSSSSKSPTASSSSP